VSVPAERAAAWQQGLDQANVDLPGSVPARQLGEVSGGAAAALVIRQAQLPQPLLQVPVAQLEARFEQAIPRRMGVDLPPTA